MLKCTFVGHGLQSLRANKTGVNCTNFILFSSKLSIKLCDKLVAVSHSSRDTRPEVTVKLP